MQILSAFLLLLDLHSPEALGALRLGRRGMVVAGMWVYLGDTESEQGERKELEGVF